MQYHLVLTDEHGRCVTVRSVGDHTAADRETRLLLTETPDWTPTRYPGRSWRRGEVAVFLDRRGPVRRELSVLRCAADHDGAPLDCPLRFLGIPALNLQATFGSAHAPTAASPPSRLR
jgi:hypothetical protein